MRNKAGYVLMLVLFASLSLEGASAGIFIRGDANYDGSVDISDPIFLKEALFVNQSIKIKCMDAADANDDGEVDINDVVYLNNFLYLGGPKPPAPYPNAGDDPTADSLICKSGQGGIEGACKQDSKETNEGPGGQFCTYDDYEECYNYRVKSTVIAYNCDLIPPGCYEADRGTDYCKDSNILEEAYLNCGITALTSDYVGWDEKDCNDFDEYGDWEYYCSSSQVLKHRRYYDLGCSDGFCKVLTGNYQPPVVVSNAGDDSYCADRVASGCTGCSQGEYDCDSDSECASGLECKDDWNPFTSDGCCKSSQIWDTSSLICMDCTPGDGPCCDANGKFRLDTYVCNTDLGVFQYACKDGNCLDNDVWKRGKRQYCSGASSACNGKEEWKTPSVDTSCSSTQYCSGSTAWSSAKPTCANAQCTSGACCDTTCGVYTYKPTTAVCSPKSEEGCPWGVNLDNDAGKRDGQQRCPGTGKDCTGQIVWGNWVIKQDCSNIQYCDISGSNSYCKDIACSQNSDCGTDGFIGSPYCYLNDVWDKWRKWTCTNAGMKSSVCNKLDDPRLSADCGDDEISDSGTYCKDGDVYKTRTTTDRGCRNSACFEDYKDEEVLVQNCPIELPCEVAGGKARCGICYKDSDCGTGGQSWYCGTDGNLHKIVTTPVCNKPGQQDSYCTYPDHDETGQVCTCGCETVGQGAQCKSNCPTCSDSIKNQDETDVDCGGTKCPACAIGKTCAVNQDCQSGYCNPSTLKCELPPCTNDCTYSGATRCFGSSQQTCGNYDADACLDWGGDISCQYGCSNNVCNKPDLTVTSISIQSPPVPLANQNITMNFIIKNIGNAPATNIFWKMDTGSTDYDPVNSVGLNLGINQSIGISTKIKYSSRGSYTAKAIADYQNKVVELNENNNERSKVIVVS